MPIDADDFAPPRDSTAIVDEAAQRPRVGLRLIAMFEALKGLVVVAAGFGLLSLLHRNVQAMAEALLRHSHLNPASRTPQIFLALAARITAADLWLLALGAAA
jgi:hypothetical protein